MFSPKLLKFTITGVVSVLVLVTAVLGASRWRPDDLGLDVDSTLVIDEGTKIEVQQWCPLCFRRLQPLTAEEHQIWQGKTRTQLEAILADQYPGASILAFGSKEVVMQFPAAVCAQCSEQEWPQSGHIGLTQDNYIAIFCEDGSLFQIYAEAPGDTLELLKAGVPFASPEECELWLINLTS